jgi:hypothetical protein
MSDGEKVRLVFRPLRDAVPWPARVRRLLKYALRACNLRCTCIEELPADGAPRSVGAGQERPKTRDKV